MLRIVLQFNGEEVSVLQTDRDQITVGRDPGSDLIIDNIGVSQNHARSFREGGSYWIEDLQSTNGTLVNGRKIDRSPLADGDRVRILKFSLVITTDAKARQAAFDEIIPPTYKV
ncbi:MAG: FHA domain-containing protein [Thiohalocapsa sp.]